MSRFNDPLSNVRVASPCPANWDEMFGDERKRFCGECKLNVYNLSAMSREEAENFVTAAEGRVCVRYFSRPDGTIITQDCPVGWAAFKRRTARMATAFASLLATLFAGLFAVSLFTRRTASATVGELVPYATPTPRPKQKPTPPPTMGAIGPKVERPLMGKMAPRNERN
ncbi:MAG: hypothetical protein LC113_08490 [Acidobacteria bacterium]|nr:hypothetical protein [Acidobacteriota bacterium]